MNNLLIIAKSREGGAGRAAYRWYSELCNEGFRVQFYDESSSSSNLFESTFYKFVKLINRVLLYLNRILGQIPFGPFSFDLLTTYHERVIEHQLSTKNDILNFHWINSGFVSRFWMLGVQSRRKVIWTLHDTWLIMANKHYEVPIRDSLIRKNFLFSILDRADLFFKRIIVERSCGFIVPSRWLAEQIAKSGVTVSRIRIVPNIVPFETFFPIENRESAKQEFNLKSNQKNIGFVCGSDLSDLRKGLDILIEGILKMDPELRQIIHLIIVGRNKGGFKIPDELSYTHLNGISNDIQMNLLYNAVDLMVVPSRADNLPQVATEAQAAGCPLIVSNVGGCPETILTNVSGKLFDPNSDSLSHVLADTLSDEKWLESARYEAFKFSRDSWESSDLCKRYYQGVQELTDLNEFLH